MRLIHTSDWHLGQTLHGQDRDHEHARFLDWLLRQLEEQRADVLLIAGDIFDTINPPLKAQERSTTSSSAPIDGCRGWRS